MLVNLFTAVKGYGVPVTLREFLDLLSALEKKLVFANWEEFYYLSRSIMVKDEKYFDKFDRAFDIYFKGIENLDDVLKILIPEDWLRKEFEKELSPEDLKKIKDLGGLEQLMEEFKKLSFEAKEKGLAVVLWAYARGTKISKKGETAMNIISYAAHMSALLGANIIKVKLPSDFLEEDPTKKAFEENNIPISTLKDRVAHIKKVAFDGKRLVVFSGGDAKDDQALMDEVLAIHHGDGNGSIIGRNCFQRSRVDALALLERMIQIYKSK